MDKNGKMVVEETTIGSDGTKTTKITKEGTDFKQTQTDGAFNEGKLTVEAVLAFLYELGIDKSKID